MKGEPGALPSLRECEALVSSEILVVECLRTLDRLRLQGRLSTTEAAERRELANEWFEAVDLVCTGRVQAGDMVDQLTPSSNTPGDSNTLVSWLREVAALRQAA